jgi:hypothetical protein
VSLELIGFLALVFLKKGGSDGHEAAIIELFR